MKVNIQLADFSNDTLIFTQRSGILSQHTLTDSCAGSDWAATPSQYQNCCGGTQNIWTDLTDQRDRSTLGFPLFSSQICYAGSEHLSPAGAGSSCAHWECGTETMQLPMGHPQTGTADCQDSPSFLSWFTGGLKDSLCSTY